MTFRVDAYPTDNFQGTVTQVRLQPVVVQNVTTYGTVITVPNRELKLKPGMTANVKIEDRQAHQRAAHSERGAALPADAGNVCRAQPAGATGIDSVRQRRRGAKRRSRWPRRRPRRRRQRNAPQAPTAAPSPAGGNASPRGPRDTQAGPGGGSGANGGDGGRSGGNGQGGGGPRCSAAAVGGGDRRQSEFQARMLERFKTMTPEEQQQFVARMKERGGDTSAFEAAMTKAPAKKGGSSCHCRRPDDRRAVCPAADDGNARPRVAFMDNQLKTVNLRLGITDGTYTEVLGAGIAGNRGSRDRRDRADATRALPRQNNGNPLMPGRGPGGPGGLAARGRGGRG